MTATSGARILPVLLAAGCFLAGCASDSHHAGNHRRFKVGQANYTVAPYQVNGVWYYPKVDYGYDERGTASWYGPGFDHRATADGEIYDMNQLSAAHKTLPLPSVVAVTNLQNGRELRLRVNDRGPFVGDRLIDVSRRAAQLLGFEGMGTAPVRVRVLKEESVQVAQAAMLGEFGGVGIAAAPPARGTEIAAAPPASPPRRIEVAAAAPPPRPVEEIAAPVPILPPAAVPPPARPTERTAARQQWPSLIASAEAAPLHATPASVTAARERSRIFVQAGAFAVPENAQRVRARIAVFGSAEIVPAKVNGAALYRVRVGPVASEAEARRLLGKVVDRGFAGARLVEQ